MPSRYQAIFYIAHPEFYESIDGYPPETHYYVEPACSRVPVTWHRARSGPWFQCTPPDARFRRQGWKIHLSATIRDSRQVLLAALPVLVEHSVPFKFAVDARVLHLINGKQWSRGRSGKFMTVYPSTDEQFLQLLPRLADATADYAGPYILSDRRYRASRVVYYRYGTIHPATSCNVMGQQTTYLTAPDGEKIVDARTPYFFLPPGIVDPVAPAAPPPPQTIALKDGRYTIQRVMGFTNAGGVYLAHDNAVDRPVVLKEARPHVGVGLTADDSVELLVHEHRILTLVADLAVGPAPYDLFTEWEHTFLVEEHLPGSTLRQHSVRACPLFYTVPTPARLASFRDDAIALFEKLARIVAALHERDVVFSDLSPNNVLVLRDSLELRLIDFEGAFAAEAPRRADMDLYTPGFAPIFGTPERPGRPRDLYALGAVMLSYLFAAQAFFELYADGLDRWLTSLTHDLRLPHEIAACIKMLMRKDPDARPSANDVANRMAQLRGRLSTGDGTWSAPSPAPSTESAETGAAAAAAGEQLALRAIAYIRSVADPARRDRLYPADMKVFGTNALSIAYGACGVAYVLRRILGHCPPDALDWLDRNPPAAKTFPPGLYVGLSGIGWALLEVGLERQAAAAMELAAAHDARWESPDLFYGAAGYGLANLKFFIATGDEKYRERAVEAGARILSVRRDEGGTSYWQSIDQVHYGLGHGASGIALFLLYLHLATGEEAWYDAGRRAIEFDLQHAVTAEQGGLGWPYNTAMTTPLLPYWKYGSAGVGTALLRYQQIDPSARWATTLDEIVEFADHKYSVSVGQFIGLAGLGNFLIDCYQMTQDARYLSRAARPLAGLRLYAIDKGEGVAFPGETLLRISCDYGTGSAGVAMFLWRYARGGQAAFMLDDLLTHRQSAARVAAPQDTAA